MINDVDTFASLKEKSVISEGDEVVVPSSGETAEDISRASVIGREGLILGGDLNIIKLKSEIHSVFLALTISNGKQQKEMTKLAQGKSVVHLHNSDLKQINLLYPTFKEQEKIGSFFSQLDKAITLHQQNLENLKTKKKGLLQKMFPKEGEKVPEVRFKEFNNLWDKRQLGDLAEIVRGASPRPIQNQKWFSDESNIGWLRIADVTEQNGRIFHLKQKLSKLGQEKTRVLTKPHLLLSIAATVGKPVINYVSTGVHDGFLIFLNPNFDREFMFQWLVMFRTNWGKYGQPGSQINLNSEIVRNQVISIPILEEQQKIGQFFKQLDDKIALEERELKLLKETKKAFLQKMFV
ncbi:restriction endonuclease subunit S [Listeria fleischmannii]|uniref:Restriction modification system DNA specificity domain-containing protein n=1 Tax=Listeria fleischmannii FSL S10-1203 TaxID=1265822 RepID=W7DHV5_9LIST|nr:restriction endonuclease subunit S [Listeria fleischmannii]EUJ49425.1 restriction modification system DNA specificity domain-containing protein [Listeria fleischmannii FSL S10-1203]